MLSSSRKARTEAMLLSGRRFSSLYGGTVQPSPMTAALPTINNYILQKHIDAVHTLQQQMLERELQCKTAGVALGEEPEDDAPLPSTRYSHMADLLLPEQEPETFEAWKAGMEQQLRQHLAQLQQHQPQQNPVKQQHEQQPVEQLPAAVKQ